MYKPVLWLSYFYEAPYIKNLYNVQSSYVYYVGSRSKIPLIGFKLQ